MTILEGQGMYYILNDSKIMVAKILYHLDDQGRMVVTSTFVDPSLRGQGIANQLMEKIIQRARTERRWIVPICSFAVKVLSHPSYADLKDPNWRA